MSVNANNIIIRGNVRKTSCDHQHNFYYYFRNANKTLSQHQKCGWWEPFWNGWSVLSPGKRQSWTSCYSPWVHRAFHSRHSSHSSHSSPSSHNRCLPQMLVPGSLQWNTLLWHQLIPDLVYQTIAFHQFFQQLHYFRKWTDFWKMFTRWTEKCQVWQNTRFWINMQSSICYFFLK